MIDTPAKSESCLIAPAIFVWLCWTLLATLVLSITLCYSIEIPTSEEWSITMNYLMGDMPLTWRNLWTAINEHRMPIPLLLSVGVIRLGGMQLWVETVFGDIVLIAITAGLLSLARRLRGRWIYADAFIPFLFLHLGHADLFVSRVTNHIVSAALILAVLMWIVSRKRIESPWTAAGAGFPLLVLPFCGANGLPVVLGGAIWLTFAAWNCGRAKPSVRWLAVAISAASIALVAFYFVDFHSTAPIPPPDSFKRWFRGSCVCLSRCMLPPNLNEIGFVYMIAPVFVAITTTLLAFRFHHDPEERCRIFGMALFVGAIATLCCGVSWGRSSLGLPACAVSRYAIISAPIMIAAYYVWVLYAPARWSDSVANALLLVLVSGFFATASEGYDMARHYDRDSRAMARAIRAGVPESYVASRNVFLSNPRSADATVARVLGRMRQLGVGPYRGVPAEKFANAEETISVAPATVERLTQSGNEWTPTGDDPQMYFALPAPRHIKAIGVRMVLDRHDRGRGIVEGFWQHSGVNRFRFDRRYERVIVPMGPDEQVVWFFVDDVMDRFRFDPDATAHRIQIREIRLLVAAESEGKPIPPANPLAAKPANSRQ